MQLCRFSCVAPHNLFSGCFWLIFPFLRTPGNTQGMDAPTALLCFTVSLSLPAVVGQPSDKSLSHWNTTSMTAGSGSIGLQHLGKCLTESQCFKKYLLKKHKRSGSTWNFLPSMFYL